MATFAFISGLLLGAIAAYLARDARVIILKGKVKRLRASTAEAKDVAKKQGEIICDLKNHIFTLEKKLFIAPPAIPPRGKMNPAMVAAAQRRGLTFPVPDEHPPDDTMQGNHD